MNLKIKNNIYKIHKYMYKSYICLTYIVLSFLKKLVLIAI